mgnify:CR=1 FL=1
MTRKSSLILGADWLDDFCFQQLRRIKRRVLPGARRTRQVKADVRGLDTRGDRLAWSMRKLA